MTYQDILDAEAAIEATSDNYNFRRQVSNVLAGAEDNAKDDKGRILSILCILSYHDQERDAEVDTFFTKLGIIP